MPELHLTSTLVLHQTESRRLTRSESRAGTLKRRSGSQVGGKSADHTEMYLVNIRLVSQADAQIQYCDRSSGISSVKLSSFSENKLCLKTAYMVSVLDVLNWALIGLSSSFPFFLWQRFPYNFSISDRVFTKCLSMTHCNGKSFFFNAWLNSKILLRNTSSILFSTWIKTSMLIDKK